MSLALPGVFTGMDTDALIESTLRAQGYRLNQLDRSKAEWEAKSKAIDSIATKVRSLRSVLTKLSSAEALRETSGTSSDSDVLQVKSAAGATEGTHSIEVNRLASAEKEVHEGVSAQDDADAMGTGNFVYTYNGETRSLIVTDEMTLEDLRDLINNDSDNPGVTASILDHEVDADHRYHLVLTGNDTGGDYAIDMTGTTLTGFETTAWTETQTAQNSQLRIDGYPAGSWIERNGNTISDVIEGASIALTGTGTATVNLNRDTSGLKEKLNNFVTAYNSMMGTIAGYTEYDQSNEQAGLLQGDTTVNALVHQVRSTMLGKMPGFVGAEDAWGSEDPFTLLAQIGLEFDREGVLTLDNSTLDSALAEDYYGVLDLIGASNTGTAITSDADLDVQFAASGSATEPGLYEVEATFVDGVLTGGRIRGKGETEWRDMTVEGDLLVGASGNDEESLRVTAVWNGAAGTQTSTADVRVQQGFAGAMSDEVANILDASEGLIKIKSDQFDDAIRRLDLRIEEEEDRLIEKEQRLRQKYARLEATLAEMDSFRASFDAVIQSVAATKKK